MWINDVYVNEKNVVTAEPYVQARDYGIIINGVAIEIGENKEIFTPEEKKKMKKHLIDTYIRDMESWR